MLIYLPYGFSYEIEVTEAAVSKEGKNSILPSFTNFFYTVRFHGIQRVEIDALVNFECCCNYSIGRINLMYLFDVIIYTLFIEC